ncbi:extracellular solute-binding protein [Pelotomaculum terephthalicicum JT]|uniref:molybdate ABC transporter substrate-binding protein n=1 Tax=Pelotomaculum sp. PtaB.Bin117 TaxID=1811694 RepID=UPI001F0377DE|nr:MULTISPECIES: extracellular solute-binding protein [Pelotomaculum]MCG9969311.1 extracellular solute-binding protein [Pelotomaculum terephthalicicum JT]
MEELRNIYTQKHPNINIRYEFGASGTLAQRIEEGEPVDIFISASESHMDALPAIK